MGTEDEKKIAEVEKKAMVIGFTRILRRAVRKMRTKRIIFDNLLIII